MTELKNWIKLILVFILSITTAIILTTSSFFDIEQITALGEDLQYNFISTSATIGGFLFTGISILISAIGNKRIERLWENSYLNNLYRAAFIGIVSNICTILSALALVVLTLSEKATQMAVRAEIISVFVSLVFFGWSVLDLLFILSRMKQSSSN